MFFSIIKYRVILLSAPILLPTGSIMQSWKKKKLFSRALSEFQFNSSYRFRRYFNCLQQIIPRFDEGTSWSVVLLLFGECKPPTRCYYFGTRRDQPRATFSSPAASALYSANSGRSPISLRLSASYPLNPQFFLVHRCSRKPEFLDVFQQVFLNVSGYFLNVCLDVFSDVFLSAFLDVCLYVYLGIFLGDFPDFFQMSFWVPF